MSRTGRGGRDKQGPENPERPPGSASELGAPRAQNRAGPLRACAVAPGTNRHNSAAGNVADGRPRGPRGCMGRRVHALSGPRESPLLPASHFWKPTTSGGAGPASSLSPAPRARVATLGPAQDPGLSPISASLMQPQLRCPFRHAPHSVPVLAIRMRTSLGSYPHGTEATPPALNTERRETGPGAPRLAVAASHGGNVPLCEGHGSAGHVAEAPFLLVPQDSAGRGQERL